MKTSGARPNALIEMPPVIMTAMMRNAGTSKNLRKKWRSSSYEAMRAVCLTTSFPNTKSQKTAPTAAESKMLIGVTWLLA